MLFLLSLYYFGLTEGRMCSWGLLRIIELTNYGTQVTVYVKYYFKFAVLKFQKNVFTKTIQGRESL